MPQDAFRLVPLSSGMELAVREFEPSGGATANEPPFLLVHGLASNSLMWTGVSRRLAAAGHRAIAVDLRGHGRSSKPDDGYDMSTVADDVALLIDALSLDRPIVAGQSWGGNVVIELAARHGDAVRGVVPVDGGMIDLGSRFADWDACKEQMAPPKLIGTPLSRIEGAIRGANKDWPEEGIQGTLGCFEVRADGTIAPWLTFDRHIMVLRGLWEHEPRTRFPHIKRPVLWFPADSGKVSWTADKRAGVDEAIGLLAKSRAHWFADAHHDVHAQKPDEVTAALLSAVIDGFFA
jgi:pimeloyl-ACP methyl ester carboxylesterase